MCNFSVNIDYLNSLPPLVRSFSINIDFPDFTPKTDVQFFN